MDLQNPTAKMSKSADSPQGTVPLLDAPDAITKKIKSAVTDSGTDIRYDPASKPGVSNLLEIHAAVTGRGVPEVEREFAGSGYGAFKSAVADAVIEALRPLQEAYAKLEADPAEVDRQLATGAAKARAIAEPVLERARTAAGLLPQSG
jgi:tryptophanyl-tRNA synthetase